MSEGYRRYSAPKIEGEARRKALAEYVHHYTELANTDRTLLNQKLPRDVFKAVLSQLGNMLKQEAARMSREDEQTVAFLERNAPPECLGNALTPEVRTFALLLNALSQWTTAEKLAMDRYLFSGNVRNELRALATTCPICPDDFDPAKLELHHPVRDGRPPIPLSKAGHDKIEDVFAPAKDDIEAINLAAHRRNSKRRYSWRRLRIGCIVELGQGLVGLGEKDIKAGRTVVRFVSKETELSTEAILAILERYSLGELFD